MLRRALSSWCADGSTATPAPSARNASRRPRPARFCIPSTASRVENGARRGYAIAAADIWSCRRTLCGQKRLHPPLRRNRRRGRLSRRPSPTSIRISPGRGNFGGKGRLRRAGAFMAAVEGKLPEGRILSHDLIEGRTGRRGLRRATSPFTMAFRRRCLRLSQAPRAAGRGATGSFCRFLFSAAALSARRRTALCGGSDAAAGQSAALPAGAARADLRCF